MWNLVWVSKSVLHMRAYEETCTSYHNLDLPSPDAILTYTPVLPPCLYMLATGIRLFPNCVVWLSHLLHAPSFFLLLFFPFLFTRGSPNNVPPRLFCLLYIILHRLSWLSWGRTYYFPASIRCLAQPWLSDPVPAPWPGFLEWSKKLFFPRMV